MSAADAPPSYDKALSEQPANPARNNNSNTNNNNDLARTQTNSSDVGGDPFEGMSEDEQREMADEYRELPDGWVKCWDPKQQHSYYVEEKTERAIWTHPYDDPEYLQSLPDTHPANPNSEAGRERREQLRKASLPPADRQRDRGDSDSSATDEDEAGPGMSSRAAMRNDADANDKGWFQRQKDKLSDKRERRAKRKEEERKARAEHDRQMRAKVEEYRKKRAELMQGQYGAQSMGRQPMYAPPAMGYRSMGYGGGGLFGPSYGYGYGQPMGMGLGGMGYRRPMGMGMGMPLGMGMMGGLGTGMLLGGAMGGYGGGYGGDCGGGDGGGGDGGGGGE